MALSRRSFVQGAVAVGAAAVAAPFVASRGAESGVAPRMPESRLPKPFTRPLTVPPVLTPTVATPNTDYHVIRMMPTTAELVPGYRTQLWSYNGSVPGPTIVAQRGRKTVARFINQLPASHPQLAYQSYASVHLHGAMSKPQYDGYASDLIQPGYFKDYRWDNTECARSIWYHDHAVHHTWTNVAMGLAGRYLIVDPDDAKFNLPTGPFDVSLHVSDAMFRDDGQLALDIPDLKGSWGDVILVNGTPWPTMQVQRRKYRFRIVNGCVSRSMFLRLSTNEPFQVIATDAGLVPKPVSVRALRMSNGERYDVVVDFSKYTPGTRVVLRNDSLPYNDGYTHTNKVMAFDVIGGQVDPRNNQVPSQLRPENEAMRLPLPVVPKVRRFRTERQGGEWTIDGYTWHDVIDSNYQLVAATPIVGDTEVWEFHNSSGGWSHPMHVHGADGRLLSRNGRSPYPYEAGPKDTYYVGENETLRILMKFEHPGKYMIHCHNGVHEDHDMMVQYEVVGLTEQGDDPLSEAAEVYQDQSL